jgi:hypothetical protein
MSHKPALNKGSRHSFIKSSKGGKRKTQVITNNSNSQINAAIRIIKNSIGSKGSINSPLVFQIGKDDCLYQIIDLKGTCFQRFRRVLWRR